MKTIEYIAENFESPAGGLIAALKKNERNSNWVIELINQAQDELAGTIAGSIVVKRHGEATDEPVVKLNKACRMASNLGCTISAIYEQYISHLKELKNVESEQTS